MKAIASRDNPAFKAMARLVASGSERRRSGASVLDGAHLLAAFLDSGRKPESLMVSRAGLEDGEVARLVERSRPAPVTLLSDPLFDALSTVASPTGVIAAVKTPVGEPVPEDAAFLDSDPKKVRGQHYDVVLNGMELGGGSIRIHQPALQKKVFEDVLKIPADVVESRFGYMLKAFTYGAPPHGGIAFGLDRMVALLCGTTSIRDVIAFPKTQKGQDLMAQSPTPVTARQLKDLHIQTVMPE